MNRWTHYLEVFHTLMVAGFLNPTVEPIKHDLVISIGEWHFFLKMQVGEIEDGEKGPGGVPSKSRLFSLE